MANKLPDSIPTKCNFTVDEKFIDALMANPENVEFVGKIVIDEGNAEGSTGNSKEYEKKPSNPQQAEFAAPKPQMGNPPPQARGYPPFGMDRNQYFYQQQGTPPPQYGAMKHAGAPAYDFPRYSEASAPYGWSHPPYPGHYSPNPAMRAGGEQHQMPGYGPPQFADQDSGQYGMPGVRNRPPSVPPRTPDVPYASPTPMSKAPPQQGMPPVQPTPDRANPSPTDIKNIPFYRPPPPPDYPNGTPGNEQYKPSEARGQTPVPPSKPKPQPNPSDMPQQMRSPMPPMQGNPMPPMHPMQGKPRPMDYGNHDGVPSSFPPHQPPQRMYQQDGQYYPYPVQSHTAPPHQYYMQNYPESMRNPGMYPGYQQYPDMYQHQPPYPYPMPHYQAHPMGMRPMMGRPMYDPHQPPQKSQQPMPPQQQSAPPAGASPQQDFKTKQAPSPHPDEAPASGSPLQPCRQSPSPGCPSTQQESPPVQDQKWTSDQTPKPGIIKKVTILDQPPEEIPPPDDHANAGDTEAETEELPSDQGDSARQSPCIKSPEPQVQQQQPVQPPRMMSPPSDDDDCGPAMFAPCMMSSVPMDVSGIGRRSRRY